MISNGDLVSTGQRINGNEYCWILAEASSTPGLHCAEFDSGNISQADQRSVDLSNHQFFKLLCIRKVGIHHQVNASGRALTGTDGGDDVIASQRLSDILGAEVVNGEFVRVQPYPHGRFAAPFQRHFQNIGNSSEAWIHVTHQVIGYYRTIHIFGKRHIKIPPSLGTVCAAHVHCGILRPRR